MDLAILLRNQINSISVTGKYSSAIFRFYVPSRPANTEIPQIIGSGSKRQFMMLHTLLDASKAHYKDCLTC